MYSRQPSVTEAMVTFCSAEFWVIVSQANQLFNLNDLPLNNLRRFLGFRIEIIEKVGNLDALL